MGINFNFGLGGKSGNSDDGKTATTSANTVITTDLNTGNTPPPTEPIMVQPPAQTVPTVAPTPVSEFGDDITINVTDAPDISPPPIPATGQVQIEEAPMETPVAPTPLTPDTEAVLNPFESQGQAAPVMTENPFATPIPSDVENQAPAAEAPVLNPFVTEVSPNPTLGVNPFASEENVPPVPNNNPFTDVNTSSSSLAADANTPVASNPFATENPFASDDTNQTVTAPEETPAVPATVPEVSTEPMNPFASDDTNQTVTAPEETPAVPATVPEVSTETMNPFASDDTNQTVTAPEERPVNDEMVSPAVETDKIKQLPENPFTDMSFETPAKTEPTAAAEPNDSVEADSKNIDQTKAATKQNPVVPIIVLPEEKTEEADEFEEIHEKEIETESKKGDGSSPLTSLENIKAEITRFVNTHNQNVADYKLQIKALENKIKAEKDLLKKRKQEFKTLLSEIETLTEDFTLLQNTDKNESLLPEVTNRNPKPNRKRNQK